MESNDTFGFGTKPCMKEVPAGLTAVFSFKELPTIVETEYGEKYSYPIVLIEHPSYDTLPLNMIWQSKCQSAKQLYNGLAKHLDKKLDLTKFDKELKQHYFSSSWVLTRFDTGAYWLDIETTAMVREK
jgi:hypothetical protein